MGEDHQKFAKLDHPRRSPVQNKRRQHLRRRATAGLVGQPSIDPEVQPGKIQCAPTARITSGGRFHPESCRLDLVADERFGRVTGWVEAS